MLPDPLCTSGVSERYHGRPHVLHLMAIPIPSAHVDLRLQILGLYLQRKVSDGDRTRSGSSKANSTGELMVGENRHHDLWSRLQTLPIQE
jgi:hypothetical protein